MKKRIISFALVLCLLLGLLPIAALAADGTALHIEFNKIPINQAYMNSARITGALVTGATRLEATPEQGEDGRVHIQVELSQATQDGDTVHIEMNVSNATNSGIGCGLKPEIIPGGLDAFSSGHVTDYDVTIENGAGQLMCYSYYNGTQYTTLVMDFVVGDTGDAWVIPHDWMANDAVLNQIYVWDQPVLKSMFQDTGAADDIPDTAGRAHNLVGYLWLEESVADDAVLGLELRRGYSNLLNKPEGWTDQGGYVQLEDGEATVTFDLQGLGGYLVGHNCHVTLYIKNHLSYAPSFEDGVTETVGLQAEVGVPFTLDLRSYFTDRDTETLTYYVSVDGGEAVQQSSSKYRYLPQSAGVKTLTVTASDGLVMSDPCTIVITAIEDHIWGDWTVLQEATCLADGKQSHTCICCGEKETQTIPAVGVHTWGDWVVTKNANCVDDGARVRTCKDCGELEHGVIAAGEHDWVITSTATCGQAGIQTATCTGCGETKTSQAPATGDHTWGVWSVATAATCVKEGVEVRSCRVCEEKAERAIPATGTHIWGVWQQTVAPSCVEGQRERGCTQCDLTQTAAIAANGEHAWSDWTITVKPTPSKTGKQIRTCANCEASEEKIAYYKQPCAYVNLSVGGTMELIRDEVPLEECNGQEGITVDDVMIMAHELYAPAGRGYSSNGEFMGMLWGDTSGAFGYLLNNDFCWSLGEVVEDGDEIYAYVYKDKAQWTDQFSYFNTGSLNVRVNEPFDLTLRRIYSDPVQGLVTVLAADAVITVDGKTTQFRTDANGQVTITLDKGGSHVISAVATGYTLVPAVCVVNVDANQTPLSAPTLTDATATATTITVTAPEASLQDPDAVVEYAISSNGSYWGDWQTSPVFTGLANSTVYYLRARYVAAATDRYQNSAASKSLQISTTDAPAAVYTFADAAGQVGQTVRIPVHLLCDAPGAAKWNVALNYDTDVFALVGVEPGADAGNWDIKVNRVTRCVSGTLPAGQSADSINGELFVLTLKVKETAPNGGYTVGLSTIWNTAAKNAFWDANGAYVKVSGMVHDAVVTVSGQTADAAMINHPVYTDVAQDAWYADEVRFMTDERLMNGTGDHIFDPDAATSRAMFVTVLYRAEGCPAVDTAAPFADVAADTWYTDAVLWAYENGIVNGTSATTFAPDGVITRQQAAAMLYRYAQWRQDDVTAVSTLEAFGDAGDVALYALRPMQWAVAEGILQGSNGQLLPDGGATRAQLAAILSRYLCR